MHPSRYRVKIMGEEVPLDQIADPEPSNEMYFADPIISPRAIDRASQIVPEQHFKSVGLHTWLSGRAKQAFAQIKVGERDVALGKLTYRFSFDHVDKPILDTVMLTP